MKDNIFLEDVDVPEIVQDKADSAFSAIYEMEGKCMMKNNEVNNKEGKKNRKIVKVAIAAAACAAVAVMAGTLTGSLKGILKHSDTASADAREETASTAAEDRLATAIDTIDRMFTLRVKAAESENGETIPIEKGHPVPVVSSDDKTAGWAFGGTEDNGDVNYCINIPSFICEGKDIESVTYSINRGAFQIVQPEDKESIVIDGQLYGETLNTGSIGGGFDENEEIPSRQFETVFYKSFTVDYDRQSDAETWINIANVLQGRKDIFDLLFSGEYSNEMQNSAIQQMLDNTVITCTASYADNTSQSVDIKVDSRIITYEEAGEPEGGMLVQDVNGERWETETVVITFELQ